MISLISSFARIDSIGLMGSVDPSASTAPTGYYYFFYDIEVETPCNIPATPSWDCDGQGNCLDPGTGNGQYPTLADCIADSCENTPDPSWDCDNGVCFDPGTGQGAYSNAADCWTDCVGNAINEEISGLLIYPNPAKNTLTIDGNYISATIYDVFGKVALTTDYQKTMDVSAVGSGLPAGPGASSGEIVFSFINLSS
mgnify:CR=1 FL=1